MQLKQMINETGVFEARTVINVLFKNALRLEYR